MLYHKKAAEDAYTPRRGRMTERIEHCLSTTKPRTAEEISKIKKGYTVST